jgi:exodeoxyribonuclease V alpha subunit
LETIKGTVNRVLFASESSDFKVFQLRRRDRALISVTGEFSHLVPGAAIEVHGAFRTHPKYGVGFKASAYTHCHDGSPNSMCLYLQAIAKWIGPERSVILVKHFGPKLEEIIEQCPERLAEVEGIGEKIARSIVEAWSANKNLKDVQIFLHSLGLTESKIRKVLTSYGPDSEKILKDNPWRLIEHGFGFSTCDSIAEKLGKERTDPTRWKSLALHALRQCASSGHLFLLQNDFVTTYNAYNRGHPWPLKDGDITWDDIAPHIATLSSDGSAVVDGNRIYDLSLFFYENESARLLHRIMVTPGSLKFGSVKGEEFIVKYEHLEGIELSEAQKEAIRSFLSEKVLVITGNPGTGKTTVVKGLVTILKLLNASFELLTPTGISAKKLGTTSGYPAYTIHRRLGYKGTHWDYNAVVKYPTQAVIVDETSMVDQEVFYRLMSALNPSTKLVFVGDNDQLPSVGPGSVLRELIDSKQIKTIFLDTIFRQDKQSDIIKAAKKVRDGDLDLSLFKSEKSADIWFIRDKDHERVERTVVKFAEELMQHNRVSDDKKHFQIITPRNEGPLSVDSLNTALQAALNPPAPDKKEFTIGRTTIRKGDRVIIRKNNYELEIFNGDIGKVAFVTPDHVTVDIEDYGDATRRVDIPMKIADEMIKMAYAITVHRAQGLEYPLVIMPFLKAHGKMLLQRNLLYTAMTRAKRKVIILGQASALEAAIANDKIQRRNTMFAERIRSWTNEQGITLRALFSKPEDYQNAESLRLLLSYEERS